MTSGARLDALLYRGNSRRCAEAPGPVGTRWLDTALGRLRVFDSGGAGPVIVFAPDGPCVIEHYEPLIALLRERFRVVCFDLPGFGFSFPRAEHDHRIERGAATILGVLEALQLEAVTLALSCVNGFYAMAAAARAPARVSRLVLAQTPSLAAMRAWTRAIVPRPVQVPILGQLLSHVTRRRIAEGWYKVALARREDRPHFHQTADQALASGACYCFAGVVQGMAREPDLPPALSGITVPVTVIWGARDRSHRATDPMSIRGLLPQADLVLFEDCGHFPELEDPARYAALMARLHAS